MFCPKASKSIQSRIIRSIYLESDTWSYRIHGV